MVELQLAIGELQPFAGLRGRADVTGPTRLADLLDEVVA
jgi:hypothetical protein